MRHRRRARKVVVLSTTRPVYPINAMGPVHLMEKVAIAKSRVGGAATSDLLHPLRQVMASRGRWSRCSSRQFSGQPLTVTDPQMRVHDVDRRRPSILVQWALSTTGAAPVTTFVQEWRPRPPSRRLALASFREGQPGR
jgi:hypothetical protein